MWIWGSDGGKRDEMVTIKPPSRAIGKNAEDDAENQRIFGGCTSWTASYLCFADLFGVSERCLLLVVYFLDHKYPLVS